MPVCLRTLSKQILELMWRFCLGSVDFKGLELLLPKQPGLLPIYNCIYTNQAIDTTKRFVSTLVTSTVRVDKADSGTLINCHE